MSDRLIEIFIMREELNEFMSNPSNVQIWTHKPADYNEADIINVTMKLDEYVEIMNGKQDGRKLLKG